jgi:hypothetical protein
MASKRGLLLKMVQVIQSFKADNVFAPYPIYRVLNKRTQAPMDLSNHRTYITPAYLSRAPKKVRDLVSAYTDHTEK